MITLNVSQVANVNPFVFPAGWSVVNSTFRVTAGALRPTNSNASGSVALAENPLTTGTLISRIKVAGNSSVTFDEHCMYFCTPAGNGYCVSIVGSKCIIYPLTAFARGSAISTTTLAAYVAGDYFTAKFAINAAASIITVFQETVSTTAAAVTKTALTYPAGMKVGFGGVFANNNGAGVVACSVDYGNATIDSLTANPKLGDSIAIETSNLGNLTSVTIGGVAVENISAPNGKGTFLMQAWTVGSVGIPLGSQKIIVGDGAKSSGTYDTDINVLPPVNRGFIKITSLNNNAGYLASYIPALDVGSYVMFATADSLSVAKNFIDDDGGIYSDYSGVQTILIRSASSGIISSHSITTGAGVAADTTPDDFAFGAISGVEVNSFVYAAASIKVEGVTPGVDIPCATGNGLQYRVDAGNGFGAWTSAVSTVRLGYVIESRLKSALTFSTPLVGILSVGGVQGTFTVTTRAIKVIPNPVTVTWPIDGVYISNGFVIDGVDVGANVPITMGAQVNCTAQYSINDGAFTNANGVTHLADSVKIKLTVSNPDALSPSVTINIGGVPVVFYAPVNSRISTTRQNNFVASYM